MLGWLGAVACAVVLGFGAFFAHRAVTVNQREAPTVGKPPMSSARPVADAPSSTAISSAAESRDVSLREARERTIHVQQRLRAEQQARKAAQQEQAKDERCIDGQRMKRVENGWVQAGRC
jgi:negative regulator of sigma E activity